MTQMGSQTAQKAPPGVFGRPRRSVPIPASTHVQLSGVVGGERAISLQLVDVWSRGSKNHHKDQCTPCFSNGSGRPCPLGQACNCCHFAHDDVKLRVHSYHSSKARKGKGKPEFSGRQAASPPAAEAQDAKVGLLNALFWRGMPPEQVARVLSSAAPDFYED